MSKTELQEYLSANGRKGGKSRSPAKLAAFKKNREAYQAKVKRALAAVK